MKKTINLNAFTSILKKGEAKNVELSIEGQKTIEGYEVKLKSISVTREMFKDLGFDDKQVIKQGETVKQPTLKELMLKGFDDINNQLVEIRQDVSSLKRNVAKLMVDVEQIKELPTIAKELKELDKPKSKTR